MKFDDCLTIKEIIPTASMVAVEGAGHDLLLNEEHYRIPLEALVKFLKL